MLGRKRAGLVLLHPSCLPDPAGAAYGIGELGGEAFRFVDFLADAGVLAWQLLPLGHTGYMNSPYQTFSRCAGSPYLVSVEKLREAGDLSSADHDAYVERVRASGSRPERADFGWLFRNKLGGCWKDSDAVLRRAFEGFEKRGPSDPRRRAYDAFQAQHGHELGGWLSDYAEYMAIKENLGHKPWSQWPAEFREATDWRKNQDRLLRENPEIARSVDFYRWLQFVFFEQWFAVRDHAHARGRLLIGDAPWYVGHDSADVWANRNVFQLDEKGTPLFVAGVPPDYFSKTGQLWGNPLYDWFKPESIDWWMNAIEFLLTTVDIVRLDHFRAIDTYWKIPWDWAQREKTATEGCWGKGPGFELLKSLQIRLQQRGRLSSTSQLPIIAEDLGFLDPLFATPAEYPPDWNPHARFQVDAAFRLLLEDQGPSLQPAFNLESGEYSTRVGVDHLLDEYGLPFMAVSHFGFEGSDRHHPETAAEGCVLYTGTHDNNTTVGWYMDLMAPRVEEKRLERKRHLDELNRQIRENGGDGHPQHEPPDGDTIIDVFKTPVLVDRPLPQRDVAWEVIERTMHGRAGLAGSTMQDLLGLGAEARLNLPGDQSREWWVWRMRGDQARYGDLAGRLRALMEKSGRVA
jgi:4-alpha-glucanotransferase